LQSTVRNVQYRLKGNLSNSSGQKSAKYSGGENPGINHTPRQSQQRMVIKLKNFWADHRIYEQRHEPVQLQLQLLLGIQFVHRALRDKRGFIFHNLKSSHFHVNKKCVYANFTLLSVRYYDDTTKDRIFAV